MSLAGRSPIRMVWSLGSHHFPHDGHRTLCGSLGFVPRSQCCGSDQSAQFGQRSQGTNVCSHLRAGHDLASAASEWMLLLATIPGPATTRPAQLTAAVPAAGRSTYDRSQDPKQSSGGCHHRTGDRRPTLAAHRAVPQTRGDRHSTWHIAPDTRPIRPRRHAVRNVGTTNPRLPRIRGRDVGTTTGKHTLRLTPIDGLARHPQNRPGPPTNQKHHPPLFCHTKARETPQMPAGAPRRDAQQPRTSPTPTCFAKACYVNLCQRSTRR
jgi:hypothetical protein